MLMRPTSNAVACYIRVSTVGQNEAGQRREVERWLAGHGIDAGAVRWFIDKRSGDNLDRPAFREMQAAIFAGEVRTVVVYKLDRLARSLRDGVNTLAGWCDQGLRVVSVTQQLDFNGATGKLLAAVLFGIAEMEQETRRERQRAGIEVAKRRGRYRGRSPGTTKGKPARALELRGQGHTVPEVARALGVSARTAARYLATAGSVAK